MDFWTEYELEHAARLIRYSIDEDNMAREQRAQAEAREARIAAGKLKGRVRCDGCTATNAAVSRATQGDNKWIW